MIERILPPATQAVETFGDRFEADLFPEEQAVMARAVNKRRREFATVRTCAREALERLGVAASPIVPGVRGMPEWPPGVVGSMTHCDGYRAAVVARLSDLLSMGIDAEPDAPLPKGVLEFVTVADDLPGIEAVSRTGLAGDRLLFSAKESVFKAWFPLTHRWLGFEGATVTLRPDGTFTAHLLVDGATTSGRTLSELDGRWLATRGLVVTAATVPA
jgi:4'-phosphopantetheinyl transferase EntD